ncbi:hypothetical protein DU490_16700 [Halomonas sp. DQ26W]|uniref:hypothetical protein n=1 Tax=Halomonas sp. DQ26W TaxID=2282311 RepID=UPI000DF7BE6D|nr:hypothetical protein [Halomonas sp. DQ26W]RDB41770.1 hypothetical protein DU490_16700 [Halomonas sp. DQ26W]
MIDFEFVFFSLSALALITGLLSLVVWGVMLLVYMQKIDVYFDSPDFPNRGYKGLWPWEMSRATSYGCFLLFHDSRFVRKKFPHACKNININEIPRSIKLMVAFPMYAFYPPALFILAGGAMLYINKWFF